MNTTSGELHKTTGFVFPGMALPTPEQGDKCNINLYDERDLQPGRKVTNYRYFGQKGSKCVTDNC